MKTEQPQPPRGPFVRIWTGMADHPNEHYRTDYAQHSRIVVGRQGKAWARRTNTGTHSHAIVHSESVRDGLVFSESIWPYCGGRAVGFLSDDLATPENVTCTKCQRKLAKRLAAQEGR